MQSNGILERFASGNDLGTTAWLQLPQEMLTAFEVLTKSNDPLHTDPDWVRRHTDFASTIAPGFLGLSLLPYFYTQLDVNPDDFHALNYGFDRIRWISPVPVNAEVRAHFRSAGIEARKKGKPGFIVQYDVTLEIRGCERPAMLARWLGALLPDSAENLG